MPIPFPLSTTLVVLMDILGLFLGLSVYWANKSNKVNRGFSLMVTTILAWVTFYHLSAVSMQHELSVFWFRLATSSVFAFFIAYYFFIVKWFLGKEGRYNLLGVFVFAYGLLFGSLATGTALFIRDLEVTNLFIIPTFHPLGWWLFYGFVIVLTLFINWVLIREYFKYDKERKTKIQYFLTGLLLFAGLNIIFNVILPVFFNIYKFYELGNYSALFLLGFTAYAIVKSNLFGIRVVLTALLVVLTALLLAVDMITYTQEMPIKLAKGITLAIFIYFGYLLIRSVLNEIKQRQQLEEAYQKLEAIDKAKSEFVSIASHQLRTPLTALKGYFSMLLEGSYGELDSRKQKPIEKMSESTDRLIRLVNDLLSLSRIESGRIAMKWEQRSVEDVIQQSLQELEMQAKEKGLRLVFEKREALVPLVKIDAEKIRNVALNIVDNAIRYTAHGKITVSIAVMRNSIVVRFQDTGAGMNKEEIAKLFESFSRGGAGTRFSTEGAGLGLYVARKFVEMHRGKIWAESQGKGQGSTFYVELPFS